jgi:hypothetical protein
VPAAHAHQIEIGAYLADRFDGGGPDADHRMPEQAPAQHDDFDTRMRDQLDRNRRTVGDDGRLQVAGKMAHQPEAGHLPALGEWLALPMVRLAGSTRAGDAVYEALFHAHAQRLLERGPPAGADAIVAIGARLGLRIFHSLAQVPGLAR